MFKPQNVKNIVTSLPMAAAPLAIMKLAIALSKSPLKTIMVVLSAMFSPPMIPMWSVPERFSCRTVVGVGACGNLLKHRDELFLDFTCNRRCAFSVRLCKTGRPDHADHRAVVLRVCAQFARQ